MLSLTASKQNGPRMFQSASTACCSGSSLFRDLAKWGLTKFLSLWEFGLVEFEYMILNNYMGNQFIISCGINGIVEYRALGF